MKHLDLFSGIGGFALAADKVWSGIDHVFCEIDPFCRAILKKHWPNAYIYEDIRTLTHARSEELGRLSQQPRSSETENRTVDILTGGFPCQPFSQAGKRKGTGDDRYLWPEMRRVIQEFSPRYIVAENVRGILSIDGGMVFEQVCADLEAIGYEVQPFLIPACAVNAPHRRDRVWIVAHLPSWGERWSQRQRSESGEPEATPRNRNCYAWSEPWPQVATRLCRMDDGLPEGMARPRGWRNAALKAYGNAIVPQVAENIFKAMKQII